MEEPLHHTESSSICLIQRTALVAYSTERAEAYDVSLNGSALPDIRSISLTYNNKALQICDLVFGGNLENFEKCF